MFEEKLSEAFGKAGLRLTDDMKLKFSLYYKLIVEWNEKINLTAITAEDEFISKHFLDSLSVYFSGDMVKENQKILDIGTGAGFPGIPLKIYSDSLNVTLLDSLQKRVKFLNEVIESLKLKNITAIQGRAEDLARTELRESFDIAVSRAVAGLPILLEYSLPFVKKDGYFIAWKGSKAKEEAEEAGNALKILGGKIEDIRKITIPNLDEERFLITIKKEGTIPSKYPRRAGTPTKKPL